MYADLTGNREKQRIKSLCDNKCEGRWIYDCFVLNEKADAIYYHGAQAVLKQLLVTTAATAANKSTILVTPGAPESSANKFYYQVKADATGFDTVTYGSAITAANWTALAANGTEITPGSGKTVVAVVEVNDTDKKPVSYGTAVLNIG